MDSDREAKNSGSLILGIGVDILDVARVQKAMKRRSESFAARILTPEELASDGNPLNPHHVARCFAAKEAAVKALGTGFSHGISFHDLQVLFQKKNNSWRLAFTGPALERARILGIKNQTLSLAGTFDLVLATVVLLGSMRRKNHVQSPAHT
jgi:holo-[acyl-carrier protein] synthase